MPLQYPYGVVGPMCPYGVVGPMCPYGVVGVDMLAYPLGGDAAVVSVETYPSSHSPSMMSSSPPHSILPTSPPPSPPSSVPPLPMPASPSPNNKRRKHPMASPMKRADPHVAPPHGTVIPPFPLVRASDTGVPPDWHAGAHVAVYVTR